MPFFVGGIMYDLKTNLEPGNPEGHTVLRYLVEVKQMPLEVAIERVYYTVNKCAGEYRSDQKKLLTGIVVTGILGLPVFFPFGVSSLLIAGAIGASAFSWQEFGVMRDRLLRSMPVLLRDTSSSELYVRLSPHTAPSRFLLFLFGNFELHEPLRGLVCAGDKICEVLPSYLVSNFHGSHPHGVTPLCPH
jgi:hypothetical protein